MVIGKDNDVLEHRFKSLTYRPSIVFKLSTVAGIEQLKREGGRARAGGNIALFFLFSPIISIN